MLARGASRGGSAADSISPEGDTSKEAVGSSKYRPPG